MGIRSDELLDCGCKLKRYISGLNVIDSVDVGSNCKISSHQGFKEYECRVKYCGLKFSSKNQMKEHRWGHAI